MENNTQFHETTSIKSAFYLSPFINGFIENTSSYFNVKNKNRLENIELLLLTQGFEKYNFEEMITTLNPKEKYKFENGFKLKGTVSPLLTTNLGLMSKNNKLIFGGIIEREEDVPNKGIKYTIRLTEHINRILKADNNGDYQDNIKIGVSVTESINLVATAKLKTPFTTNGVEVGSVPLAAIINPLGTVLYGNIVTDPSPEEQAKKLKLDIYFTKPN